MGLFDKDSTKSQSTTTSVPDYVSNASQSLVKNASSRASSGPTAYKAPLVANFNADQKNAFQRLRELAGQGAGVADEATGLARSYAMAPAQSVSTERIVDENGQLGAISDYINPSVAAALEPALRRIQEQADSQRKRIGAQATSAGAFGDARQGILESTLGRDTSTAVGDTSANFFMQAFNNAMGQRQNDLNRFLDVDKTNAGYNEQELSRMLTGAQAIPQAAMAELPFIQQLMGVGDRRQSQDQAGKTAKYNEFLRQNNDQYSLLNSLAQALGSAQFDRTQTTESTEPDNWIAGTLGSLGSSYLGSTAGSAAVSAAVPAMLAAI